MGMFSNLKKMEERKEKNAIHFSTPPVEKPEELTKKPESQKVNKIQKQEIIRKSENQQRDLSESQRNDILGTSTKTSKRFTTYLTKASLRAIRIIADDEDRHDYEVFQEAIDFYLDHKKK
jgi:hypothetical protein